MVEIYPGTRNFIKTQIMNPCAKPWWVWVETFVPAFVKLFITVVILDLNDALRARGKKISAGAGMRGGRGRGAKRSIKVIGVPIEIERWQQRGLRTLLVVTQPLEWIGLAWLLYAATDRFFYDWQTLLEDSGYCKTSDALGPLTRRRGPGFISLVEGGVPVILPVLEQNRASWGSSSTGAGLPFGHFTAVFALTVVGPLFGVSGLWIQLRSSFFGIDEISRSETLRLGQDAVGDLTVSHNFSYSTFAGGALTWEIGGATVPIGINTVKGFMSVFKRS